MVSLSKPTRPASRSAAATISRSLSRRAPFGSSPGAAPGSAAPPAVTVPPRSSRARRTAEGPRQGPPSVVLSGVARGLPDVREEVEERAHRDPVTHLRVDVVEELVQGLLGVPVGALEVRVVAAEHDVLVAHPEDRLRRGLVVLERDLDLPLDELLRRHGQRR